MATTLAPGLTADWINAWLAAIGITVIVPNSQLRWTDHPLPIAEIDITDETSAAVTIANALPSIDTLATLAIARHHVDAQEPFPRHVSVDAYRDRARLARAELDFSLASTVTDLISDPKRLTDLAHSPFDPPVPKGLTLHERLVDCAEALNEQTTVEEAVAATLQGTARRIKANGLGFDYRRIASGSHSNAEKYVDPVVELLAFYGLALFPITGDGHVERPRGWNDRPSRQHAFRWPTWTPWLDRWGIDALLDRAQLAITPTRRRLRLLGVTAVFATVSYAPTGASDATRAYASERLS
jgi:hypothetical protein